MIDRVYLMELVRDRQIGNVSRREFLQRATAVLGSAVAANTLLAACAPTAGSAPPPVVDSTEPVPEPGLETVDGLTTGIVTYPGPEGTELMGYMAYDPEGLARPAVIVIQEWWGLNEHIKDVTRRFAAAGFVALAPDLYHGQVTTEPDEARKLAMALSTADAVAEIEAAAGYLRDQPVVDGAVGVVGFCMGGGLVLQTAARTDAVDAAVSFYGSPLSDREAEEVDAPVLSFLGTEDNLPVSRLEAMHAAFEDNDLENEYHIYEGAQHAFFNDTRASYDPEAAADAWEKTLEWFRMYMNA